MKMRMVRRRKVSGMSSGKVNGDITAKRMNVVSEENHETLTFWIYLSMVTGWIPSNLSTSPTVTTGMGERGDSGAIATH